MITSHSLHGQRAPRRKLIALCVLQACTTAAFGAAQPAPAAAADPLMQGDVVLVSGQRASMRRALAGQHRANHVLSMVSSDDIGGLPDKNAAEALARLPGVAVQRDQGEGRYIVVRGMGPDYNAVTINGALVPSPESGRRAVALDVLPAGLVRSLEVSKTLTPDRDANSLGGTVEVKSLSGFDLPGQTLSFQAGASYDQNTGETSPQASALATGRFMAGKAAVAVGISGERRRFGSDNVETGGAWRDGKLDGLELRNYLPERERKALALNLDYRPTDGTAVYLRSFASRFSDDEVRDRLTLSNIENAAGDEEAAPGETFSARAERRLRQRKYTQEISSVVLGTDLRAGDWKLGASAGASEATEKTPESINDARFRGTADFSGLRFDGTNVPRLNGPATLAQPASYRLQGFTLQARDSRDRERHAKLDITRQLDAGDMRIEIKGGVKASRRSKDNDTEQWGYSSSRVGNSNYWGAGSTAMSDFVGGALDYPFFTLGPGINPALVRARVAGLDRAAARLLAASSSDDYHMDEDIDAAYLQTGFYLGRLHLLGGVRHERTGFKADGKRINDDGVTPLTGSRSYANWLPTVQARFDLDTDTSVRAAWTNAVVRANFSQLAPGITIDGDSEAVIGNPDLKPLRAANLDLGVERLCGTDCAMSVYLYAKNIKDFTYTTDLAGTGVWKDFDVATSYANGGRAKVRGIELSYTSALRGLPAPWNGLLVGANASFNTAKASIGRFDAGSGAFRSREIRMPGQSKQVMNLMLGYERGPVSTRVAVNHKSPYLLEVGGDVLDAAGDTYVDSQRQVDFSFAYQFSKKLQLVFEGVNLTNERYYVYQGTKPYNAQYEQYGRTYKLSLKVNLF
jgi:TonB-dependent receptor